MTTITARANRLVLRAGKARHDRLAANGWTFAESPDLPGSGQTNPYTRQIVFSPKVAARQSRRDIFYVAEHEVGHALDFDAGIPSVALAAMIGLNNASAQEALAEAVAYWARSSTLEKTWILSSIVWHLKSKWRWQYGWTDVRKPQTRELADMLVRGPGHGGGTYFVWAGLKIVKHP